MALTAGGRTQIRSVRSGTSYLSQDDLRQHFGLGAAETAERLRVVWPDGSTSEVAGVAADRKLVIEQKAAPDSAPAEPAPEPPAEGAAG